jgi:hypothetical protein
MDILHDASEGEIPAIHKKSKLSPLPTFGKTTYDGTRETEIDKLVDALNRATQVRVEHHSTPVQDLATIPTLLETILDRMWEGVDPAEKLIWISKDIIKVLVTTICLNAKRYQNYSTAIDICRHLIYESREGSTAFARTVLSHLSSHKDCTGVADSLCQLIYVVPLRSILIEELAVTKLFSIYTNVHVEYNPLESIIKDTTRPPDDHKLLSDYDKSKNHSSSNFKLDTLPYNPPPTRYFSAPSVLAQDGKDGANHNNHDSSDSPPMERRGLHHQQSFQQLPHSHSHSHQPQTQPQQPPSPQQQANQPQEVNYISIYFMFRKSSPFVLSYFYIHTF